MQSRISILFLILLMNKFSFATPVYDIPLEQAIKDEKYLTAFKLLNVGFKKSASLHSDTLSYYLYQTTECLFKIRNIRNLEILLQLCETNKDWLNAYYQEKINVIRANYWKEKGDLGKVDMLLNTAIVNCNYPDVKADYVLLLASLNLMKGNTDISEKLYRQVYYYSKNDTQQIACACNGIGACFAYASKYDSAQYYYNKAVKLYEMYLGRWNTKTAQVNYNLALIENKHGDYVSAEKMIRDVLMIYQSKLGEKHIRTAEAYGELGSIYMLQDNLDKALYYVIKERDILSLLYNNKHPDIAYSCLNLGKIYFYLNDLANAELQLKNGIELLSGLNAVNSYTYTQLIIELSRVLNKKKEYAASTALLKKLLNDPEMEDEFKADIYLQSGENYLASNDPAKAETYFELANKIYIDVYGEKNVYSTDALIGISNCYLQNKDFIKANEFAYLASQKTILNNKIIFPYDHWECRLQELICKKELYNHHLLVHENIESDISTIKNVLAEANRIRQTYYSNVSQIYYTEKMAELNQLGIYFLTHFYKKIDLFFLNNLLFFAENNKANLLRNKITNNISNEILPQDVQDESSAIIGKLNHFTSLNENQEKPDFDINDSILFYQNKYELFTKSIEKQYPKIYRLKYGKKPLTVQQIQIKLPKKYSFLEYCNDNENYYCIAISKNSITYKICGNKTKIDSLINQHQISIINKKFNVDISQQLHSYLLPKLLLLHLLISADDKIHCVAFDALTLSRNTADYLIYNYSTQYAFSINTYFNHQPFIKNKTVAAFYPDFTNTQYAVLNNQKEHDALKLFPNYNVYYKENARKDNFITQCNFAGIIHVSSHLIIDTTAPLKSFLVFQPGSNYTLSINDIWKLNTNCQLITLASCQSNFGKTQCGEGVQNFAWAFHYAGARNILSTQWNASDKSTSGIISNFYKNLNLGKSKEEALQLAKINYLNMTDAVGAQPFFWANFSLFVDETPIHIAPNFLSRFWWMPVVFLFLFFISILTYQKVYLKIIQNNA